MAPKYRLVYHAGIPGRGEYVRLVLEAAGVPYEDTAKLPNGQALVAPALSGTPDDVGPHRAPPVLFVEEHADGKLLSSCSLSQTPVIVSYLARRHGLAPASEQECLFAEQLSLTVLSDFVNEIHATHHPLDITLRFEEQSGEARRNAEAFVDKRLSKFVAYFGHAVVAARKFNEQTGCGPFIFGKDICWVDLILWHTMLGVKHAFPKSYATELATEAGKILKEVMNAVQEYAHVKAYLASDRRAEFSFGLFRDHFASDM